MPNFGEIPSSMSSGRRISIRPNSFFLILVPHTNTSQWAIMKAKLILDKLKSVASVHSINVLGYCVGSEVIKLDSERFHPLRELPPSENSKSLKMALGMVAYYAKWINKFSYKIWPLIKAKNSHLRRGHLKLSIN